jgi:hypothetical protein
MAPVIDCWPFIVIVSLLLHISHTLRTSLGSLCQAWKLVGFTSIQIPGTYHFSQPVAPSVGQFRLVNGHARQLSGCGFAVNLEIVIRRVREAHE